MQMLHTTYTLKSLYHIKAWNEMWRLATGLVQKYIKFHVLSRWDHVGEAIWDIMKYNTYWVLVLEYIININNVSMNRNDIVSYIYSYLKEDVIYSQIVICA